MLTFIKSTFRINHDIYNLMLKSLYLKLNIFLIDYYDNKNFWFKKYQNTNTCAFIEKFMKLKVDFIENICSFTKIDAEIIKSGDHLEFNKALIANNTNSSDKKDKPDLEIDLFCSFHKIFFKNLYGILSDISLTYKSDSENYLKTYSDSDFLMPTKLDIIGNLWKFNHLNEKYFNSMSNHICLYMKNFFNKKLITWRYLFIKSKTNKKEMCRICELEFSMNDFFFHARYCMEKKVYIKGLMDIRNKIKKVLDDIKAYKENRKTTQKRRTLDAGNSPRTKLLEGEKLDIFDDKSPLDPIDYFDLIFKKERYHSSESYEKNPNLLVALNKSIHYLTDQIYIQSIQKNVNESLCDIYFKLVQILVLKDKIVEMLLLDKKEQEQIKSTNINLLRASENVVTNKLLTFQFQKFPRKRRNSMKIFNPMTIRSVNNEGTDPNRSILKIPSSQTPIIKSRQRNFSINIDNLNLNMNMNINMNINNMNINHMNNMNNFNSSSLFNKNIQSFSVKDDILDSDRLPAKVKKTAKNLFFKSAIEPIGNY